MSIRRGKRPDTRFLLSWEAQGMLAYIATAGPVSTANLIKQTQFTRKPTRRDAVRSILAELIDAGLVVVINKRASSDGTFNGVYYAAAKGDV